MGDGEQTIAIIAAVSDNNVIGRDNELPWAIKADLQHFAELTKGQAVICGRKTHESILKRLGHPLKGRKTVVLTRQKEYQVPDGCVQAASWEEALKEAAEKEKIFVIGGEEIFKMALPDAQKMHLTRVHKIIDSGDAFFPQYDAGEWRLVSQERHSGNGENNPGFTFETHERIISK